MFVILGAKCDGQMGIRRLCFVPSEVVVYSSYVLLQRRVKAAGARGILCY